VVEVFDGRQINSLDSNTTVRTRPASSGNSVVGCILQATNKGMRNNEGQLVV